jgi:phage terminase large subunit
MRPAAATLRRWKERPAAMVKEEFHEDPDAWQLEVLALFARQDLSRLRLSLQACVGPGKTAVLAWIAWNFLTCYGDKLEHPKGAAVSVDWPNLKANLWPELSKWQQRSEFLKRAFTWTAHRISSNEFPQTWFLDARGWAKTADQEALGKTLSGLHSKYVLALVDESGTIPLPILKAAEQALSNCEFGRIVQAGNPSSLEGMLHIAATTQRHLWHVVRITGDPDDPKRSPRINIEWAREQIKLYGRNDPWVKYSILGEFPPASINSLLGIDDVQAAIERDLEPSAYSWSQKRLGVDVARFGDDITVLFPRQGLKAGTLKSGAVEMRHPRGSPVSVDIANRVMLARSRWRQEVTMLDATGGWAAGARDILISTPGAGTILNIQYGAPAPDQRYKNMRAYMWWHGAQWVKNGGQLPNIPELPAELTVPTYTYDQDGHLIIEPKERIKERLGRSPNYADALFQTFSQPEMANELEEKLRGRNRGQAQSDFDPYRDSEQHQAQSDFDPFRDQGGL